MTDDDVIVDRYTQHLSFLPRSAEDVGRVPVHLDVDQLAAWRAYVRAQLEIAIAGIYPYYDVPRVDYDRALDLLTASAISN